MRLNSEYLVAVLGEKLDGGESLDLDVGQFVGRGVHLSNDNVSVVLELLTELVPDWSELLAVTAPRRIYNTSSNNHFL